eukprot:scaffold12304_cov78-Phaeocystis_antarctica.AAC.1
MYGPSNVSPPKSEGHSERAIGPNPEAEPRLPPATGAAESARTNCAANPADVTTWACRAFLHRAKSLGRCLVASAWNSLNGCGPDVCACGPGTGRGAWARRRTHMGAFWL